MIERSWPMGTGSPRVRVPLGDYSSAELDRRAERSRSRVRGFTREAFRFFLGAGGYATPPGRVACARELARAEYTGLARSWDVSWEDTGGPCYCADDDVRCQCDRERERWEHRTRELGYAPRSGWECQCKTATLATPADFGERDASGGELGSWEVVLRWEYSRSGICGADASYRRVVRAELFAERLVEGELELDDAERWDAFLRRVPAGPWELGPGGAPRVLGGATAVLGDHPGDVLGVR